VATCHRCTTKATSGPVRPNAIAAALEWDALMHDEAYGTPSRLFIYYEERRREGSVSWDAGAYGHDGYKCARRQGAPPEDLWPYDVTRFAETPPQDLYAAAEEHRIARYVHPGLPLGRSLDNRRDGFKWLLSRQVPITFGFTVYESFETSAVARDGIVPVPGTRRGDPGRARGLARWLLARHAFVRAMSQLMGPGLGNGRLLPHAMADDLLPNVC
jgi:hypothetical protein